VDDGQWIEVDRILRRTMARGAEFTFYGTFLYGTEFAALVLKGGTIHIALKTEITKVMEQNLL